MSFAAADSRKIEQIVDQPDHVRSLPGHHRDQVVLTVPVLEHQQIDPRPQRRERVSQLVSKHCEKLVLPAIGFAERRGVGLELRR